MWKRALYLYIYLALTIQCLATHCVWSAWHFESHTRHVLPFQDILKKSGFSTGHFHCIFSPFESHAIVTFFTVAVSLLWVSTLWNWKSQWCIIIFYLWEHMKKHLICENVWRSKCLRQTLCVYVLGGGRGRHIVGLNSWWRSNLWEQYLYVDMFL